MFSLWSNACSHLSQEATRGTWTGTRTRLWVSFQAPPACVDSEPNLGAEMLLWGTHTRLLQDVVEHQVCICHPGLLGAIFS